MSKQAIMLIVDDVIVNRLILKELFISKYKVIEAENGKDALEIIHSLNESISIILTDIVMPVMDGLELIKLVRENERYAHIPIIVTTQINDVETEIKALELGADDFITKPYNPLIVKSRVLSALSKTYVFSQKLEENLQINNVINRFNSRHDFLTKIYNRNTFFEETDKLLKKNCDKLYTMVSWNINSFRVINDFLGKTIADEMLIRLGQKLDEVLHGHGTYSRFEADHFMTCFPKNFIDINEFNLLVKEYVNDSHKAFNVTIGLGIYEITDHSLTVEQMCYRADLALDVTRGQYVTNVCYYDDSLRKKLVAEQEIINEMNTALEQNQFFIQLQPVMSLSENKPIGAEALVRWQHPTKGLISPGVFIPIFENNGFITKLDYFVWEETCKVLKYAKDNGYPDRPISVNVSRINFYNKNLSTILTKLVKKYDISPHLLRLEITESAYTDNPIQLNQMIQKLKNSGFIILMDDFGSGFSSLNMLKDLNVDILKIDRNFIKEIEVSEKAKRVLNSIIRLASWLEMTPIAEGVETKKQCDYLKGIGCDRIQGFYFYRPLDVEKYLEVILENKHLNGKEEKPVLKTDGLKKLREMMQENTLANEMIGAMAIYEIVDQKIKTVEVDQTFYKMVDITPKELFSGDLDNLSWVYEEDRDNLVKHFYQAFDCDEVVRFSFRGYTYNNNISTFTIRMHSVKTIKVKKYVFTIINLV